ncbi:hypothetical protein acsn021_25940 [Anaerocolumna cellulosilytica]|uniref:Uncharacterized protein n=1 Tax=Anaerocolumna cellulosilytica TaxID=433286 RepID=A0A6S6R6X6_9FIRM|nr:uncharacterized protein YggT (Ycf19 family) [Anaerocolumna cellulosilytica]BCJ95025.1 hypothetical protein acsn021_25940 [Anaerocolumna cellulosilytica]
MLSLIYNVFYVFFVILEIILFLYVLTSWMQFHKGFRDFLGTLTEPLLGPIRHLLRHSIFNNPTADLAPLIGFVVILFLQDFFYTLK